MVFTVQVFTLLQNQCAFQICQGGTKVPCIDAAVSGRFAAGKLCAVCAFPAALALAQWVNYAINYEHMVFHTAVARICSRARICGGGIAMTKLTPRAGSGLLFCVGIAEERGAPGTAVAEADSRRKMSNPTFCTMIGLEQWRIFIND